MSDQTLLNDILERQDYILAILVKICEKLNITMDIKYTVEEDNNET
jgi:hypothetical protein